MDFTGNSQPDFTTPAPNANQPEPQDSAGEPDFTSPGAPAPPSTPARQRSASTEDKPRRTRTRSTEPQPANHIRTIDTGSWKQQQADAFKRPYLGNW